MCGGGKDSLATMLILDDMNVEYDSIVYTNTAYGLYKR